MQNAGRARVAFDVKSIGKIAGCVGLCALFFLAYLLLDRLSYVDTLRPFAIMAWNPALGISVAIVVCWGRRALPLVFIAPFVAALLIRGFPLTGFYTAFVGALAVLKAFSISRLGAKISAAGKDSILKDRQTGLLLATIPVTLAAAVLQAGVLTALNLLPHEEFSGTIERLWIGDLIGIFVQLPFCLLVFNFARAPLRPNVLNLKEIVLQTIFTVFALWLVFVDHWQNASAYFYVLFLPMLWIVLTHGLVGAVILNMVVQATTISYLLSIDSAHIDLTLFQALAGVFVASALALGLSIEENRRSAERLRDRERELSATLKARATSELAGALAHELSHPIGAISNYATVIDDLIKDTDPEARVIFGKLRQEARRAKDTLHRLREFFRSGTMVVEKTDLIRALKESISLLKSHTGHEDASIRILEEDDDITVTADRIQLHGVLRNILVNALDAIRSMPLARKTILLRTWRSDGYGHVSVEDAGPGIAPDVKDHIFEPLVTTKKDGLGLGLSISRSIIQAHGGRIECSTSALGGAKFHISLPLDSESR